MKIVTCLAMCIHWPDHVAYNDKDTIFVKYCLIGQTENQVKFMNISTEHSAINQSLMNENGVNHNDSLPELDNYVTISTPVLI